MANIKTALVLEGGGMRGAYTAGALSWLIDNGIEFDNAYGISTGAIYLASYLMHSKEKLFTYSVEGITDKRIVGLKAFLRSGRIVDYEYLFEHILPEELAFDISPLKDCKVNAYIGLYDLAKGKTEYKPIQELAMKEFQASTSLPIIGKTVVHEGREILDGGITDMIPIERAVEDGCNRSLVITTKPAAYVRKPAKKAVIKLMKYTYPQCERISEDYSIRHLNYNKQISEIKELEENKKAVYMHPSKESKVTRLGGSREELIELYELGYNDMEARRADIFELLGKND